MMILEKTTEIFTVDNLEVRIFPDREALGKAAAEDVAAHMKKEMAKREYINMVFAAAPSQEEFLKNIILKTNLNWQKTIAFHMDEYLGLPIDSPASFGEFLKKRLFDILPFNKIYYLNSRSIEPEKECSRYSALLRKHPIDIAVMGIGENGHIAFNDPQVADFNDPKLVKIIQLDDACRQQQVNDGCFNSFNDVPALAMTMTVPALFSSEKIFCIVPGSSKADAVQRTLYGPVGPACPASVLREHPQAVLYLDRESAG